MADSSGLFSCKSAFAWLRRDNSFSVNHQAICIWKLSILVKVKVFIWLLALDKLNVQSNLQRRGTYHALSLGWCILCKKDNESIDYLFLHCDFAFTLWSNILKEFGTDWVIPRSSKDLMTLGQGLSLLKKGNTL